MTKFWRLPPGRSWEAGAYDEAFRGLFRTLDVPISEKRPYVSLRRAWLRRVRLYKDAGALGDGAEADSREKRIAACLPLGLRARSGAFMTCEELPCPQCYGRRFLRKACRLIHARFGASRSGYRLAVYHDDESVYWRMQDRGLKRPRWAREFSDAAAGIVLSLPIPGREALSTRIILVDWPDDGETIRGKKALAEFVGFAFAYPDDWFRPQERSLLDVSEGSMLLFMRDKSRWFSTFGALYGADSPED